MFYLASYKYGLKRQYIDNHGKRVRKRLRLEKAPWFFSMLEPQVAQHIEENECLSRHRVGQNVRVHGLIDPKGQGGDSSTCVRGLSGRLG